MGMIWWKTFVNETLGDDKLKLLGYESIGVRYMLMCYIAKSPVTNWLYRTESEPYTDDEISALLWGGLHERLQKWLQIKIELLKYGGFAIDSKNALGIPQFFNYQSDYYRQKKYRVTQKVTAKVTQQVTKRLPTKSKSNSKLELKLKSNNNNSVGSENPEPTVSVVNQILSHWNEKNIIIHKLNDKIRSKVNSVLKENTVDEIKTAIDNYYLILTGQEYWFKYKWTLIDFIGRGLEKFKNIEIAKSNYLRRDNVSGNSKPARIDYSGFDPNKDYKKIIFDDGTEEMIK